MAPDGWTAVLVEKYPRSSDEPLSHCIVRLVAIAADQTVTEFEPLARAIDVDAIDALFSPTRSNSAEQTVQLSFHYDGYHVDNEADGTVTLLVEPEEEE